MSPAAAAGADLEPVTTAANPAEPPADQEDKSKPVGHGPARGAGLRLFIVHVPEDVWFVEGFLLEALRLPDGEVLISSQLEPGR